MYSADKTGLDDADPDVLLVLTEYLDRGITDYCTARPEDTRGLHLRQGIHHRYLIGQAQGILMERHAIGSVDALHLLQLNATNIGEPIWRYATALIADHSNHTV